MRVVVAGVLVVVMVALWRWDVRAGEAWWSVLFLVAEYNTADASHATSVGGFLATSELRRRIGSEGETNRGSSCLQDAPTRAKGEASGGRLRRLVRGFWRAVHVLAAVCSDLLGVQERRELVFCGSCSRLFGAGEGFRGAGDLLVYSGVVVR